MPKDKDYLPMKDPFISELFHREYAGFCHECIKCAVNAVNIPCIYAIISQCHAGFWEGMSYIYLRIHCIYIWVCAYNENVLCQRRELYLCKNNEQNSWIY